MTARRTIIVRLLLLLIGGAIVNVAVATSLWFWGERPARGTVESIDFWQSKHSSEHDIVKWKRWAENHWPPAPDQMLHQEKFGMQFSWMVDTTGRFDATGLPSAEWQQKAAKRRSFSLTTTECGWPMTWLAAHLANEIIGMPPTETVRRSGWVLGRVWIPNEIRFDRFCLNTIFYAAILWLLFAVPGMIRKRRRIKRGLCPACAYPGGVNEVCTECGAKRPTSAHVAPGDSPSAR